MRALDLFAGAGGWDVAAKRLGIHPDGVEIMREANLTRVSAGLETVGHDVWNYDLNVGRDYDGLIASPPCQTFSQAGKGKGRDALDRVLGLIERGWDDIADLRRQGEALGDERTALVLTPLHYAYEMRPQWIAWEQVPTVLPVWEACADQLFNMGYSVWTGNLQAEQYGVPQTRKRAFLIASRVKRVGPPEPTHSQYHPRNPERLDPDVKKWVSMAEGLGWPARIADHPTIGWTAVRPSTTVMADPRIAAAGHHISHQKAEAVPSSEATRWCWERPATTVVGSFCPDVIAAPGYRTTVSRQNAPGGVRVTVAEAGILQSFPADYPWQGAKGKQFLQCGNAVPPLLAEAVLSAVVDNVRSVA